MLYSCNIEKVDKLSVVMDTYIYMCIVAKNFD